MGSISEVILDLIYPRRCPVCMDIVVPKGNKICPLCRGKLIYINEPRCKKCSKAIVDVEQEYCYDCSKRKLSYEKGYSLFEYDGVMKRSISEFKFHSKKEYADFYIEELNAKYGTWMKSLALDALIPVPIHSDKRKQRGFNQAEILAKGISKSIEIPVYNNILIRNKNTTPQKLLDNIERVKNLKNAFAVSDEFMEAKELSFLKRVMLIDDIYTTGATIDICAKVLKSIGVNEVYFMTVCIGKGY